MADGMASPSPIPSETEESLVPRTEAALYRVKLAEILVKAVTAELAERGDITKIVRLEKGELPSGCIDTHRAAIDDLCAFRETLLSQISGVRYPDDGPDLVDYAYCLIEWIENVRSSSLTPIAVQNNKFAAKHPAIHAKLTGTLPRKHAKLNGETRRSRSDPNNQRFATVDDALDSIEYRVRELQIRVKAFERSVGTLIHRKRIVQALRAAQPMNWSRSSNEDTIKSLAQNVQRLIDENSRAYATFKKSRQDQAARISRLDEFVQTIPETFAPSLLPVRIKESDVLSAVQEIVGQEVASLKIKADLACTAESQARREGLLLAFGQKINPVLDLWQGLMASGSL